MAGYIFTLDSRDSLEQCVLEGSYSTRLIAPTGYWKIHHEATFGDYVTMRPGDRVFFFIDRLIYGVGELVGISGAPAFNNFPGSGIPEEKKYREIKSNILVDAGDESPNHRWVCFFTPAPYFFKAGVDMDAVLNSNPSKFKMLRAFWKRSFIKCDDDETQALVDVILKFNQDAIASPPGQVFKDSHHSVHDRARKLIEAQPDQYVLDPSSMLAACSTGEVLRHEMALESGLLWKLHHLDSSAVDTFGKWDYLSHQVAASPFKPIDYMDRMDIFGYRFIDGHRPTKSTFLVGELKKDAASPEDVDQLMKYVDWVQQEYASGDYSAIEAFLVASEINQDVVNHARTNGKRIFTSGSRPVKTGHWSKMKLVQYRFNEGSSDLEFSEVRA
jgi:hypothetical protein